MQKIAISVILGEPYSSYTKSLRKLNLEELSSRHVKLCMKFAQKDIRKTRSLLSVRKETYSTRNRQKISEPKCRTLTYYNSSIPYLSRLVNNSDHS